MDRLQHLFLSCWRETIAHEQPATRSRRFNTYQNDLHSYSLEHCLHTCHGLNHKAKIIITTTSAVWSMSTCAITCRAIYIDTDTTHGFLNLSQSQDILLYAGAGWCQSKDFAVRLVNRRKSSGSSCPTILPLPSPPMPRGTLLLPHYIFLFSSGL